MSTRDEDWKKSVQRKILRSLRGELEPRTETARDFPPQCGTPMQIQHLTGGLLHEPGALRQFPFELAFAPSSVTDKSADDHRFIAQAFLRFLDHEMMVAFHPLRIGAPFESGKNELISGNRTSEKNGHVTQRAEFPIGQQFSHRAARRTIQGQAE